MAVSRKAGLENFLPENPFYPDVIFAKFDSGFLIEKRRETARKGSITLW